MRILVADDDSATRLILSKMLEKLGHEVIEAQDGSDAWDRFQESRVRLIITDWMMPELDGLRLCQLVRAEKDTRYVYIILLTSLKGRSNFLEAMEAGADDFLNKPVDADEVRARLRVAERILALQQEVGMLERLLPICMYCKKIKDEEDSWHEIERYVGQRTETEFSHGICPTCYAKRIEPQLQ